MTLATAAIGISVVSIVISVVSLVLSYRGRP
jgi:hypothetical protein